MAVNVPDVHLNPSLRLNAKVRRSKGQLKSRL